MNTLEQARKHTIVYDRPAANFFEGALLGNGGLGAVVTTRPDSVLIHFGHNNVWDIRIAENNQDQIGTFNHLFAKLALSWLLQRPRHCSLGLAPRVASS